MKIAIIGYGKMGRAVEQVVLKKGHKIVLRIDDSNLEDFNIKNLKKADIAFEFTNPEVAFVNITKCFDAHVPVVCGSTGWLDKWKDVVLRCKIENQAFFYAPNFSIGLNIFLKINQYLASIMNNFEEYSVAVEETHHIHKLDAPSGTAIRIAQDIINKLERKSNWVKDNQNGDEEIEVKSFRIGEVPGLHKVVYNSSIDTIEISHNAKSRIGLAQGALLAAEFMADKQGVYGMDDLLNL